MPYQIINQTTGQLETVESEPWRWKAIYANGQVLKQFNEETMRFHRFAEIDQSQLKEFIMYSPDYEHSVSFPFVSTWKLLHFYRKGQVTVPAGEDQVFTHSFKFYIFGYETESESHLMTLDIYGNVFMHTDTPSLAESEAYRLIA